ncbi:unnamed protein product [Caenorhabditis sp. 36 PRJEB53466]|nr:unnamed protein product [Caenorhabditis sp. 36 PRJEB53466]
MNSYPGDIVVSPRDDIIAMLSAAGYHRARVVSLNDYDRIVGGIAWGITRFDDVSVAANLLYEESEDRNIKLRTEQSEKIIVALKAIGCPTQLSAHQLFCLDFLPLKEVIQWLLRNVLQQHQHRKEFSEWFDKDFPNDTKAVLDFHARLNRTNVDRPPVTRHMKRMDASIMFDSAMDAKCTLAEYVTYARTGQRLYPSKSFAQPEDTFEDLGVDSSEASTKKYVPKNTVRKMMEKAIVEITKNETPAVKAARERICAEIDEFNIPVQMGSLAHRITQEAERYYEAKCEFQDLSEEFDNLIKSKSTEKYIAEVEKITEIMQKFQDTHARANDLRALTFQDMEESKAAEKKMRLNLDENGELKSYCPAQREIVDEYIKKTDVFAERFRDVVALQYRLERCISVTLTSHYRKRSLERVENAAELCEKAKGSVIEYNVTIDILTISSKITGFMNEVEKSLKHEPQSQEYRDAFVAYMNDVRNQLSEYHWKAKQAQDKTIEEKMNLSNVRAQLIQKEREMAQSFAEMERLFRMNKLLNSIIKEMDAIEEKCPAFQTRKQEIIKELSQSSSQ